MHVLLHSECIYMLIYVLLIDTQTKKSSEIELLINVHATLV